MDILIISYAIFPSQSPRANRTTELAIELSRQGHNVTIYALLGKFDYAGFEKQYKLKVKNIGKLIFPISTSDNVFQRSFREKVFTKLLLRITEFPYIQLMFKIPGIIKKEKKHDLLISLAWPHPIHWGCALAKKKINSKFPKRWIADCGDPFMGNKVHNARFFYFRYIEKWFCRKVDFITVPTINSINGYYPEFHNKIKVIPQGFNFDNLEVRKTKIDNKIPTFAYSGVFYKDYRDPTAFLNYLTTSNSCFKFILYTKNNSLIKPFMEKLKDRIEIRDYIPRQQLLKELSEMDFLVNFENGTTIQTPSKLIDYAIVNRPILSINNNRFNKDTIDEFLHGKFDKQYKIENLQQYNVVNVARSFTQLSAT